MLRPLYFAVFLYLYIYSFQLFRDLPVLFLSFLLASKKLFVILSYFTLCMCLSHPSSLSSMTVSIGLIFCSFLIGVFRIPSILLSNLFYHLLYFFLCFTIFHFLAGIIVIFGDII